MTYVERVLWPIGTLGDKIFFAIGVAVTEKDATIYISYTVAVPISVTHRIQRSNSIINRGSFPEKSKV